MIYNDENIGIREVVAYINKYIKIISLDGEKKLYLNLNREKHNFNNLPINESINLIEHLYWDTSLQTNETYYLFDITKEKINLTKLNDNIFRIEVDIKNPDMIYCPLGEKETFHNLKIDAEFSFVFEESNKE